MSRVPLREPAPGRKAGDRWALPATLLTLGLIATGLLILSDWIRERLLLEDVGRMHALGEIQSRVATAHLWIEEHVTDDDVALDEVYEHLNRSQMLALAMLGRADGGASSANFEIEPLTDDETLRTAEELLAALEEFAELSKRRERGHAAGESVGIGSAHDIHYDHVFQQVLATATAIDQTIGIRMLHNHRRSRGLFGAIVAAWVIIVALAVTGLTAREQRQANAEAALRAREEELFQARKIEAVGRLAGGIAHDINNYLAAITAQCERAKMKAEPDSRLARRMGRVITTALKASALIKQLLAFTRRQPMRLRTLDLNRSVEDLTVLMRQLMGEDFQIETQLTSPLWPVEMDPSQLEQIIVNLLVNAREAMPGGGTVLITTANLPTASPESVELVISDDGPGIAPEIRDKLFEPFFTTKAETGGSGLGLATVYGIVTQAGGTVHVESTVGDGTRFVIRLPKSEGVGEHEETAVDAPVGGSERILLVDDNDAF
ncbi:MAG: ATP-binding protein, partial [Acidobacteriota bacterium]